MIRAALVLAVVLVLVFLWIWRTDGLWLLDEAPRPSDLSDEEGLRDGERQGPSC